MAINKNLARIDESYIPPPRIAAIEEDRGSARLTLVQAARRSRGYGAAARAKREVRLWMASETRYLW